MESVTPGRRPTKYSSQVARPSIGQATIRSQHDWRSRSTLRIRAWDLPSGVTTNEIYKNFEQYGNVVHILIHETGQGGRSSVAEINFEPVPATDFWSQRRILFHRYGSNSNYDQVSNVKVALANSQRQEQLISSPVNEKIQYPEKVIVSGTRLDFGILSGPAAMMVMHSCAEGHQASKLLLNLKRKEIEVHFTFIHEGTSGSKARSFRFVIALDEQFNIWQVSANSFVIQLSKPPHYSKMLSESRDESHTRDGRAWSVEDMWARQADLCAQTAIYKRLESMPVTLQKQLNTINIARWTTFCFHTSNESEAQGVTQIFIAALKDWNVPVQINHNFEMNQAPPELEYTCWSVINGIHDNDLPSTFLQDLSRIEIEFPVRYQLEVCISNGWISEYSISPQFLEQLAQWPSQKAKQALVYVATDARRIYDPMTIFTDIHYSKPLRYRRLPDYCTEVYSATVTATSLLFHTPSVEISNRIIRKYKSKADRFLRVRFEDDDYRGHTRLFPSLNNKMVTIFKRVKRALRNGIILGNIKYKFLAWGNSQLREHGVWFVAPTGDMTADRIRDEMGSFKETVVAKKAARMGQCFSTTQPVHLPKLPAVTSDTVIPDIKRGRFIFSDGVGKISPLAARLVTHELNIKGPVPSLFQFRLGGCKGVLAVANDLSGISIQIRESQFKFNSLSGDLEIIRWAQFWQPFLNRQIILCLNHLGVPANTFLRMQNEAVHALNKAMTDETAALTALRSNVDPNQMTLSLCELVEAGFLTSKEPFTLALLHLWRAWSLKYLKEKAKIPVSQGAFVLGCVDETATLRGHTKDCPSGERSEIERDPLYIQKLPEIFVQITDVATGRTKVIEGLCILARNPSLYPGDIRVVVARDVPALHHAVDVVVMPQTGERDLPSMCSGGDLDGDDYIVIWDPALIPQTWNTEPFHYEPPPPKTVANEITATHLIEFFHDYLRYDTLGRIATAHLAAADALDDGLDSSICRELAELHSQAVDYPKTGRPAIMHRKLERDRWPHFMEKFTKRTYTSRKVLGQLYDAVKKVEFEPNYNVSFDERILGSYDPPTDLIDRLRVIKADYDSSLQRILTQHGIGTEFELWSTFVLYHSKVSKDYKFHEEAGSMSKVLKDQFHEVLTELADGKDFDHLAPVAVAAYKLTKIELDEAKAKTSSSCKYGDAAEVRMPFISFPWVLQDTLIKIVTQVEKSRKKASAIDAVDSTLEVSNDRENTANNPNVNEIALISSAAENLSSEPPATMKTDEDKCSDLYGLGLDSANTESSSNNESALVTPTSDQETIMCLIEEPKQNEELGSVSTSTVQDQNIEALVDIEVPIKHNDNVQSLQKPRVGTDDTIGVPTPFLRLGDVSLNASTTSKNEVEIQQPQELTDKQWTRFLDSQEATTGTRLGKSSDEPLVCQLWRNGQCRSSEETCRLAHHENGRGGAWLQTCWYWKNSATCSRGDDCLFAHWDTGKVSVPPVYSSRTPSRRDHRGSPSKRRRRQPLAHLVPAPDSDSDMDPVSQARRFPRKSHTERTAQPDSEDDDEDDADANEPSNERAGPQSQAIGASATERNLAIEDVLPVRTLVTSTETVSPSRPKTPQANLLAQGPEIPLPESTTTPQQPDTAKKLVIPPWNVAGRSGHVVNLYHESGQVQSSRLVLDDPADHANDSDYEVDEIFD